MEPFENQVGGSVPILKFKDKLYKAARPFEIEFYETIHQNFAQLVPWMPKYIGQTAFGAKEFTNILNNAGDDFDWATFLSQEKQDLVTKQVVDRKTARFIVIGDDTHAFKKPCILDIKLGLRQYPPFVSKEKVLKQMRKSWNSTSRIFGLRIAGLQLWDATNDRFEVLTKSYGKKIGCNDFITCLLRYFSYTKPSRNDTIQYKSHIRLSIVESMLKKIQELKQLMSLPCKYRFFSSSLLLIHEGLRTLPYETGSMTPPCPVRFERDWNSLAPLISHRFPGGEELRTTTSIPLSKSTIQQRPLAQKKRISQDDSKMERKILVTSSGKRTSMKEEAKQGGASHTSTGNSRVSSNNRNSSHSHSNSSSSECDEHKSSRNRSSGSQTRKERCFRPPRICVKMIDYSNVHPLQILLPQMKEQRTKSESNLTKEADVIVKEKTEADKKVLEKNNENHKNNAEEEEGEGFIWLDEEVDNEQEPDHGVLLGLEALCLLLTELKDTGTIKKRRNDEWITLIQSIPCYEKAIKPITKVLQ